VAAEEERVERERLRRWRYEMRTGRKHHGKSSGGNDCRPKYEQYEFVAFDGEATNDCGYCLLGCSDSSDIRAKGTAKQDRLTTEDCFEFLLDKRREYPYAIFVIFGGRYDFDEMFRMSMPWQRISQLKTFGATYWHGYKINQAEGKFCDISKQGTSIRVFEIHGWFHSSYEKALEKWQIPVKARDRELIHAGKLARGSFEWKDIQNVAKYMHAELRYMPTLMDTIREICLDAGFRPRNWYGPSALATELLRKNHIRDYMSVCPEAVGIAAQYAYAGGRFEMPRGGIIDRPIYSIDWNSAYITAALEVPCLAHGKWRHGNKFEPGKFGIYHIRYYETDTAGHPIKTDNRRIYPLFRRYSNGNVLFGHRVSGWYWNPEAELVRFDKAATFLESWIYEPGCTHKPFAFAAETYRKRMVLDAAGSPAGLAFKWALAAIYGQLCRQVGWDRKHKLPPRYHQLEWAGYITSRCRAEMYRIASQCGDKLLSIDTDSVTALCPIPIEKCQIGKALGQWKLSQADGGIFYQNGIYITQKAGEWSVKSRGIGEDANSIHRNITPILTPEILRTAIETGKSVKLNPKTRYITLRMALNSRTQDAGNWEEHPSDTLVFGGGGKRYHNVRSCRYTCNGGLHLFLHNVPRENWSNPLLQNYDSVIYPLPWKDQKKPQDMELIRDIVWVDPERIDSEDAWLVRLVEKERKYPTVRGAEVIGGAR
jgi:hypothetical protein